MNSSAKTSYHHTNLRQALLDQAFAVVAERGLEGLSVRELARTVGVSTAAPFRHFKNRQALIVAMAELAAASLRASFLQALKDCAPLPPLERFAALGRAYVQWAAAEPVYFRVMNDQAAMDEVPEMFQDHLVTLSLMGELLLPIYGKQRVVHVVAMHLRDDGAGPDRVERGEVRLRHEAERRGAGGLGDGGRPRGDGPDSGGPQKRAAFHGVSCVF